MENEHFCSSYVIKTQKVYSLLVRYTNLVQKAEKSLIVIYLDSWVATSQMRDVFP